MKVWGNAELPERPGMKLEFFVIGRTVNPRMSPPGLLYEYDRTGRWPMSTS